MSKSFTRRQALVTAAGFAAVASLPAFAAPKENLILGAANSTSSHYALGVAMTKALQANMPKANLTLLETGGGLDNLRRLQRNEIDLAQIGFDSGVNAVKGEAEFAGRAIPDVVVVYPYGVSFQNIVVRKDSGITKLEDLEGKRFSPGIRGSSAEALMRNVFNVLGIKPTLVPGTLADGAEGVQNRQLVGMAISTAGPVMTAAVRELNVSTELLAIDITAAQKAKIDGKFNGIEVLPIPPTASPGNAKVNGLAWRNVYVTRTGVMDDDTAYAVAKAIFENRRFLIESWPALSDFDFKQMALSAETAGLKLHPGAKRFWESAK
jgi:TRAP transporter TAXI family solute receptor